MPAYPHCCPRCNATTSAYALCCDKCGALLFNPRHTTRMMRVDPTLLRLRRTSTALVNASVELCERNVQLVIRGVIERVAFEEGTELVLGRRDMSRSSEDCFDLTPYGAHERGVSRTHAVLRFSNGELQVTDLGSSNGTTLNAQRLAPNEPTTLHDNDDLILGRLAIRIRFVSAGETDKFLALNGIPGVSKPISPITTAKTLDTEPVPKLTPTPE